MAQHKCGAPILAGGTGDEKPADAHIQTLVDLVKPEFLKQSKVNAAQFKAVSYKSQVVAGTNYFVKVAVGGDHYVFLRIYEPLPHTGQKASLASYQTGKTAHDHVGFF